MEKIRETILRISMSRAPHDMPRSKSRLRTTNLAPCGEPENSESVIQVVA